MSNGINCDLSMNNIAKKNIKFVYQSKKTYRSMSASVKSGVTA